VSVSRSHRANRDQVSSFGLQHCIDELAYRPLRHHKPVWLV
jgi:hypothetical protein